MAGWTAQDIPDLSGDTALVTGANSGLGFHTSLQLARHGARVLMAARDESRAAAALAKLSAAVPAASVEAVALDLADLSSVRAAAQDVAGRCDRLDILVNNGGVMAPPYRQTVDGFELQLGTNHLGPFALTGLLVPLLLAAPGGRVVTVSSHAHRTGGIAFDDLQSERSYLAMLAYSQSKLANLLFAAELDRRARAAGTSLISVAAHPGLAATKLMAPRAGDGQGRLRGLATGIGFRVFGQSAARGALPQLYAATMPDVVGGEYFGPSRLGEWRGPPTRVDRGPAAKDASAGGRLWAVSEQLTGVTYDLPVPTP